MLSLSFHLIIIIVLVMLVLLLAQQHQGGIVAVVASSPPPPTTMLEHHQQQTSIAAPASIPAEKETEQQAMIDHHQDDSCYLYLAPSSIPGAGMGVFTTRPFSRGSTILSSDYGPLIPIIDGNAVHDHWLGLFNNYIWGHFSMAPDQLWYEADVVTDYQLGLGIFPNYHPFLVNLGAELAKHVTYDDERYDDDDDDGHGGGGERGPVLHDHHAGSVGEGAYSDYVGRSFFAITDIEAGDELFLDYGEQYLNDRSPSMDGIPRSLDYEMAGEIVEQVTKEFLSSSSSSSSSLLCLLMNKDDNKTVVEKEMEDVMTSSSSSSLQHECVNTSNITNSSSTSAEEIANELLLLLRRSLQASFPRVASLIPSNFQQLQHVVTSSRVAMQQVSQRRRRKSSLEEEEEEDLQLLVESSSDEEEEDDESMIHNYHGIALAKSNLLQRNITWIQENGACIDNLMSAKSDIPGAGRGAKARRNIHKGDLIAPMPLLHVRHQEEFFTYQTYHTSNGEFVMDKNDQVGRQLLYNYCFGDAELSLLLCPTTNGILANHCSDQCDSPNAEIRWSNDPRTQMWLLKSPGEISMEKNWVLSFDLVATRDISKGEEIFIDYGKEWIQAWTAHQDKINLKRDHESSSSKRHQDLPTLDMFSACYYWEDEDAVVDDFGPEEISWKKFDDTTAIQKLGKDGSKFKLNSSEEDEQQGSFWPCSILETKNSSTISSRPHSETTYTVRIFQSPWHDMAPWARIDIPRILTNFPASSVKMFYKPYKSPMHSRDAFRHYVGIPSHIIPNHWREKNIMEFTKTFRHGDRVEVKDTKTDSWRTGTVVVKDGSPPSIMMDDGNVIIRSNIPKENVRWATSHLMQIISKTHPFSD